MSQRLSSRAAAVDRGRRGGVLFAAPAARGRPALVPWARVHLVWIDGRLGSRSLAVLPRGEGPHKVRYLPLPADPVRTDGLDALLRRYSGGQVGLAEHPPEDDGGDLPRGARVVPQPRRRAPVHTVAPRRLLSAGPALILLLPVVLALPEPWNQPWWPGAHLTLRAPDPCAALSPDLTAAVIGDAVAAHRTGDGGGASGCSVESGSTTLIVRYSVHTATFGSSVREADAYLHTAEPDGRTERLALGDDAWLAGKAPGSRAIYLGPSQLLVSRRGNVVVEVSYTGAGDPAVVRPAVVAIGTRAVQSIRLG